MATATASITQGSDVISGALLLHPCLPIPCRTPSPLLYHDRRRRPATNQRAVGHGLANRWLRPPERRARALEHVRRRSAARCPPRSNEAELSLSESRLRQTTHQCSMPACSRCRRRRRPRRGAPAQHRWPRRRATGTARSLRGSGARLRPCAAGCGRSHAGPTRCKARRFAGRARSARSSMVRRLGRRSPAPWTRSGSPPEPAGCTYEHGPPHGELAVALTGGLLHGRPRDPPGL